jgi:hypothetical protein
MDDLDILKPRNPLTAMRHRREVRWQILAPVVGFSVVLLVLAILATGLSSQKASVWADISIIFLIIPALLIALITMLIFAAGVYAVTMLLQVLPFHFFRAQNGFFRMNLQVGRLTNKIVEPFFKIHTSNAALRNLAHQARRGPKQGKQEKKS